MQAIGKWLIGALLGWLADLVRGLWADYQERKRIERERKEANERAVVKLEGAESEAEVIDRGGDVLSR